MTFPIVLDPKGDEQKIFNAIKNNELIIFYGAGVSMLGGCEGWDGLSINLINGLDEVFTSLEKRNLVEIAKNNPERSITTCYSRILKRNPEKMEELFYDQIIKSVTPPSDKINEFILIHEKLLKLKAVTYITTNIDEGFEAIGDKVLLSSKTITDLTSPSCPKGDQLISLIRNGNAFYLHGRKNNIRESIFTSTNYFKFYQQERVVRFLREVFKGNYTVLFLGYGLKDREILSTIFTVSNPGDPGSVINHFTIQPCKEDERKLFSLDVDYLGSFSIKAIPYNIGVDNYSELFNVIDYLIDIVNETSITRVSMHKTLNLKK